MRSMLRDALTSCDPTVSDNIPIIPLIPPRGRFQASSFPEFPSVATTRWTGHGWYAISLDCSCV